MNTVFYSSFIQFFKLYFFIFCSFIQLLLLFFAYLYSILMHCFIINQSFAVYLYSDLQFTSSSCPAISTDIPDPLSPPLTIFHCFRQVFRTTSRIGTEQLYVGSCWSSCLCSSIWRGPQEYIAYELVPTSPAVSRMSGSSNFDSFRDGW